MRADRLLSIMLLLQARGRMTAHELAEHLEVSERTIYRDLDALSIAGIPVYTESGPGGGCELQDGYQTRLTGMSIAEVQALFTAGTYMLGHPLGSTSELEAALLKIAAALPNRSRTGADTVRARIYVDRSSQDTHYTALLQTIQDALWNDQALCLVYRHANARTGTYRINPYGLVARGRGWYLIADRQGSMNVFRLSQIVAVEDSGQRFERQDRFDLAAFWHVWVSRRSLGHSYKREVRPVAQPGSLGATGTNGLQKKQFQFAIQKKPHYPPLQKNGFRLLKKSNLNLFFKKTQFATTDAA